MTIQELDNKVENIIKSTLNTTIQTGKTTTDQNT